MSALLKPLLTLALLLHTALSLKIHFYRTSCPQAELAVNSIVKQRFEKDHICSSLFAVLAFPRLYHQNSHGDNIAEKEAPPNLSLRGFDIINEIKATLERQCLGVVSCTDILALATRDGVALSGGALYGLPIGRIDGFVSSITEAHIPDPASSVATALSPFQSFNLDISDRTTLLGAHSLGFCHCLFFINRLYDFEGTGLPDPDMDLSTLDALRKKCPKLVSTISNISSDPKAFINKATTTPFHLDNSFYHGILNGEAVLQLDQEPAFTSLTNDRFGSQICQQSKIFYTSILKGHDQIGQCGCFNRRRRDSKELQKSKQ